MLIEGVDYFVFQVPFPKTKTHGMVLLNDDGTYTILIDVNATDAQKAKALKHEIDHIADDDMHGDKCVADVEPALKRKKAPHVKTAEELSEEWINSWRDTMERCRIEMEKMKSESAKTAKAAKRKLQPPNAAGREVGVDNSTDRKGMC